MVFMKIPFSKVSVFIPSPSKWGRFFFLVVTVLTSSIADAMPPFQKFNKNSDSLFSFKLNAIVDPEAIKPGDRFTLYLNLEISAGWHIYSLYAKENKEQSLTTKIILKSDVFIPSGLWEEPIPVIEWDGALEKIVKTHTQVVEFRRWYKTIEPISSGFHEIKGSIVIRACNNKICNLPRKILYKTQIKVIDGGNVDSSR
jgi:hypothetical protein